MKEDHRKRRRSLVAKRKKVLQNMKPGPKKRKLKKCFQEERDLLTRLNRIAVWGQRQQNLAKERQLKTTHKEELIQLEKEKKYYEKWKSIQKDFPDLLKLRQKRFPEQFPDFRGFE